MTSIVTSFLTASSNLEAEQSRASLARQGAQQALQTDLIKKFVEGPRPEIVRENLRFLADTGLIPDYAASIQKYLAANPNAAPQVGNRLDFSPAGEAVSADLQQRLRETVGQFRKFLQAKGFDNLDDDISVFVYSKERKPPIQDTLLDDKPNSAYYKNTLYIHKSLADDPSIALREFTHYALAKAVAGAVVKQTAVESALADYLPATFLNSPLIGSAYSKVNDMQWAVRDLSNNHAYDDNAKRREWFGRGVIWAEALWACRNTSQPEGVDSLILPVWRELGVLALEGNLVEARFGSLLGAAPPPQGGCFKAQITARGLPMQK
jgi:hypothetical protein